MTARWLLGLPAPVVAVLQAIEDVDLNGAEETFATIQSLCPQMPAREVEVLISYLQLWQNQAARIESGAEPTTFLNNAWEDQVEQLRDSAIADARHAVRTYGRVAA